jgi:glycosyltransferase involved in cell wall biosynthesis
MRVLGIVPAYNEAESVGDVVAGLRAHVPGVVVLVVDDGSTDGTAARAREAGALVCRLGLNLGIGGAVQTGFRYAAGRDFAAVFQCDGDGQHPGSEVGAVLAPVLAGEADAVIGSRGPQTDYRMPPLRRLGSVMLRQLITWACGVRLRDVTSGFRAYSPAAAAFLAENYPLQFPEPESIVWLARGGFRIVQVPVAMEPRRRGRTSINLAKATWYMFRVSLGIGITALRSLGLRGKEARQCTHNCS